VSVRYALPLSFSSFLLDILYALFSICILAPGNEKWDHRGDVPCGAGSGMLQSGGGLLQIFSLGIGLSNHELHSRWTSESVCFQVL